MSGIDVRESSAPVERQAQGWLVRMDQGLLSVADQVVVSGSNFVSTLILARMLDVSDFGRFWLGFTVIALVGALQNGFLVQPFVLRGSVFDEREFRRYVSAHVVLQFTFAGITAVLTMLLAMLWEPLRPVAMAVVVGTVGYELQGFCRRVLYTRARVGGVFVNDLLGYGFQAVLIGIFAVSTGVTAAGALWLVAITSLLAALLGLYQLGPFVGVRRGELLRVVRDDFEISRWTGAIASLATISTFAWPVILSGVASLRATAGLGIMTQLLGPLRLFLRPLDNYYIAAASRALARDGTPGVNRTLGRAVGLFALPYFAYVLVMGVLGPHLLPMIYGEVYREHGVSLRIFAAAAALYFPLALLDVEIQARRLLYVALIDVMSAAVITYTVGLYLAARWEVLGVAISYVLEAAVQIGVLLLFIVRARATAAAASFGRAQGP